ncbi:hypothetical protein FHS59_001188 [Algoriphagus iocasae]|uniref:Uncharacterized protein n=1 Tax=Algoriphagus iocasae TaxID=1836499 RepID=A0A841MFK9_9BACT|nr:hypothetical protein [Algoriphagus iocasae]
MLALSRNEIKYRVLRFTKEFEVENRVRVKNLLEGGRRNDGFKFG